MLARSIISGDKKETDVIKCGYGSKPQRVWSFIESRFENNPLPLTLIILETTPSLGGLSAFGCLPAGDFSQLLMFLHITRHPDLRDEID